MEAPDLSGISLLVTISEPALGIFGMQATVSQREDSRNCTAGSTPCQFAIKRPQWGLKAMAHGQQRSQSSQLSVRAREGSQDTRHSCGAIKVWRGTLGPSEIWVPLEFPEC